VSDWVATVEHRISACVDGIAQAPEMRPRGLELFDHHQQMADRTGEAVETDHHQGFAGADVAQAAGEYGAIGAGGLLFQDGGAAGGTQLVALRLRALFIGKPARSPPGGRRCWFCGLWAASCRFGLLGGPVLQFNKVFANDRLQRWPG
jgi:hypothetical protein